MGAPCRMQAKYARGTHTRCRVKPVFRHDEPSLHHTQLPRVRGRLAGADDRGPAVARLVGRRSSCCSCDTVAAAIHDTIGSACPAQLLLPQLQPRPLFPQLHITQAPIVDFVFLLRAGPCVSMGLGKMPFRVQVGGENEGRDKLITLWVKAFQ